MSFVFKKKTWVRFAELSAHVTFKEVNKRFFKKQDLKHAVSIKNCLFLIGNFVFKQDIDILIGIGPAPFWLNLFLYFFE